MDPMGFEPTTPWLRAKYSDQTELRIRNSEKNKEFKNIFSNDTLARCEHIFYSEKI